MRHLWLLSTKMAASCSLVCCGEEDSDKAAIGMCCTVPLLAVYNQDVVVMMYVIYFTLLISQFYTDTVVTHVGIGTPCCRC